MSLKAVNGHMESPSNGDVPQGMEEAPVEEEDHHLDFQDDVHQATTLKSLNMMRKNRHFCDVILHMTHGLSMGINTHGISLPTDGKINFNVLKPYFDHIVTYQVLKYEGRYSFAQHCRLQR